MATIAAVDERRRELGSFLRSRRERLTPDALGLVADGRRRTPGLRREEVAQHSGVGLTWYTWLEQGRAINASAQVLAAVAESLRMDRFERAHLFTLAGLPDPDVVEECETVPTTLRRLIEAVAPFPAFVLTHRYDVVAWNDPWAAVMGDVSALEPDRRNLLWLLFDEPAWRELLLDWERDVRYVVANFRGTMAAHLTEPAWTGLVAELEEASPDFRRLWTRHEVSGPSRKHKRIVHPQAGLIEVDNSSYWASEQPGMRMVVSTPRDERSLEAIGSLLQAPPWCPWRNA
jgi:transcriptional regulator with XRE-family HTH domain